MLIARIKKTYRPTRPFVIGIPLFLSPDGFQRIRYYGLLANRYRAENLERCRALLGVAPTQEPAEKDTSEEEEEDWQERLLRLTGIDPTLCPACREGRLKLLATVEPEPSESDPTSRGPP